ncbi:hypothetical protein E8E11_006840 [Didymella keratinophila]|nr:hypothetical protein E8E11_006840 [Didymella keratinophila]
MLNYDKLQNIVRRKLYGLFVLSKTRLHDPIGACEITDDIDLRSLFTTQVEVHKYNSAIIVLQTSRVTSKATPQAAKSAQDAGAHTLIANHKAARRVAQRPTAGDSAYRIDDQNSEVQERNVRPPKDLLRKSAVIPESKTRRSQRLKQTTPVERRRGPANTSSDIDNHNVLTNDETEVVDLDSVMSQELPVNLELNLSASRRPNNDIDDSAFPVSVDEEDEDLRASIEDDAARKKRDEAGRLEQPSMRTEALVSLPGTDLEIL